MLEAVAAPIRALKPVADPKPKNGQYFVALLVGGPADIYRELVDRLAARKSIVLRYHREYQKQHSAGHHMPEDVDVVIILKDMVDHPTYWNTKDAAKARGVRVISTQRKWTSMNQALLMAGFKSRGVDPLPLNVTSTIMRTPEPPAPIVEPMPEPVPPAPPTETINEVAVAAPASTAPAEVPLPDIATLLKQLRARMRLDQVKSVLLTKSEQTVQYEEGA